jgi:hypothetical protein
MPDDALAELIVRPALCGPFRRHSCWPEARRASPIAPWSPECW